MEESIHQISLLKCLVVVASEEQTLEASTHTAVASEAVAVAAASVASTLMARAVVAIHSGSNRKTPMLVVGIACSAPPPLPTEQCTTLLDDSIHHFARRSTQRNSPSDSKQVGLLAHCRCKLASTARALSQTLTTNTTAFLSNLTAATTRRV
jgi:hypothetical protein